MTACYALLLLAIVFPAGVALFVQKDILPVYLTPWPWVLAATLAACEALLLFLSVDTSFRKLRPRRHIAVTIALASFFTVLLFLAGVLAFSVGVYGDEGGPISSWVEEQPSAAILALPGFWLIWAVLFYLHLRGSPQPVSAAVTWLLKGSAMELLIAVPAHVVARQRGDCCAPFVASWGIVTGIAVMLFAFGPGVLALYKKRYDAYHRPRGAGV